LQEDNRLPEGISCTGYDADTGRKYYADNKTSVTYVGAPYAEYGVLTPLKGQTTAREDNSMPVILHDCIKYLH
jgi:hypothetical protein